MVSRPISLTHPLSYAFFTTMTHVIKDCRLKPNKSTLRRGPCHEVEILKHRAVGEMVKLDGSGDGGKGNEEGGKGENALESLTALRIKRAIARRWWAPPVFSGEETIETA